MQPVKLASPDALVSLLLPPVQDSVAPAVPVPGLIDSVMDTPATAGLAAWTCGCVGNATPPVAPPPGCWLKLRVPAANTDASGTSDAMSATARLTANNLRRDKLGPGWVIRLSSNPRRGP